MTKGRVTCEILKQIRADIAKANQIDYAPEVCSFKGECAGTCPKCEQELQFLELQLIKKRRVNNPVAIAGVALGLMASITACNSASKSETKSNSTAAPNLEVAHNSTHKDSLVDHNNLLSQKNNKLNIKFATNNNSSELFETMGKSLAFQNTLQIAIDSIKLSNNHSISIYRTGDVLRVPGGISNIDYGPDFFQYVYEYKDPKKTDTVDFKNYPYFNDDPDSLENYIESRFLYPSNVKIKQTSITLNFLVNKYGSLSSINISKSLHKDIDNQIKTIFLNMPNWNPAKDTHNMAYDVKMKAKLEITPTEIKVIHVKKVKVIY